MDNEEVLFLLLSCILEQFFGKFYVFGVISFWPLWIVEIYYVGWFRVTMVFAEESVGCNEIIIVV